MKEFIHKIEVVVDKIIPLLLVVLLVIIVGEFGYHDFMEEHRLVIEILDGIVVFVFVLDLIFKYIRIKNFPKFLRASWIDILAIFPFFLLFRLFEGLIGLFGAGETVARAQQVVHVGVELEKEVGGALKEGERLAKESSRFGKLGEFVRPVARSFRFFKFGDPHVQKEAKKETRSLSKATEGVVREAEKEGEAIYKGTKKVVKEAEKIPRHMKAALFYEKPKIMRHVNDKFNKQKKKEK